MAGGPIFPRSAYPTTSAAFPWVYVGAGANSKHEEVLGVANATTLAADTIWRLRFQMPPALPTGTGKLLLRGITAGTGDVKVNAKWASVAAAESPSGATLNAEGTTTITFAAGDVNEYVNTKITLDADTLVASEEVVMDLTFEDSGFTLNDVSGWIPSIIWE